MAVCVAGDFDPDEMIATIDKYFGDMQPNENLPKLEFEPEPRSPSPSCARSTVWRPRTSRWLASAGRHGQVMGRGQHRGQHHL